MVVYASLDIRHFNRLMCISFYLKLALLSVRVTASLAFVMLARTKQRDPVRASNTAQQIPRLKLLFTAALRISRLLSPSGSSHSFSSA